MKKLLIIFFCLAAGIIKGQGVRVGLGAGYAIGSGNGSSGGMLFVLEPGYQFSDKFVMNLRIENVSITRGSVRDLPAGVTLPENSITSFSINFQSYLGKGGLVKPFLGLGVGVFSLPRVEVPNSPNFVEAGSKLGLYPQAGVEVGHFILVLEYNTIGKTSVVDEFGYPTPDSMVNSYLAARIGYFVGPFKK